MSFHSKKNKSEAVGFTLVELMVTISIAVAIMSVVVFNQATYIDGASVRNSADDISLSLSEAQIYGTSVRQVSAGSGIFDAAYGLSFNISASGSNNAYIFFADTGGTESLYDSGWACPTTAGSECLRKTSLSNGNRIVEICEIPVSGTEACNVGRVDITFLRPDPQARFVYFDTSGNLINFSDPNGVRIRILSPAGKERSVLVYKTGQISVQ